MQPYFQSKVSLNMLNSLLRDNEITTNLAFQPGYIAEVAIADDQTRRFVQERFKIGTEDERRLGMAAALNSFPMLSHDEKGSSVLQGTGIL